MAGNYFGDGGDGNVTISSDTQLTVLNKNGSYDGDMIVKNYNNLTINEGFTLTTDQACRGMLIYVKNDLIVNGTLSMSARGAYANPTVAGGSDNSIVSTTGLRLPVFTATGTDTLSAADFAGCGTAAVSAMANQGGISGNGTIFTLVRQGAAGGGSVSGSHANGSSGSAGGTGQTGGGGSGCSGSGGFSGAGSYGSCFAGGSAGAGTNNGSVAGGTAWAGPGGSISTNNGGGGAGNPGGSSPTASGNTGVGGLLILIVGGSIVIGNSGIISANGTLGGNAYAPGGSSGGGNILVLYKDTFSNDGSIIANGGTAVSNGGRLGGAGGDGSVQIANIEGSYTISGEISDNGRIFVFDESNWSLLTNDTVSAGIYDVSTTVSGKVMVVARKDSTGELLGYGDVTPQQ